MTLLVAALAVWLLTWCALGPREAPWRVLSRLDPTMGAGPLSAPTGTVHPVQRDATRRGAGRSQRRAAPVPRGGEVPVVADLLAVAVGAGAPLRQALIDVACVLRSAGGDSPLTTGAARLERGEDLTEVLDGIARAGTGWHALATLVSLSVDSGVSPVGSLRRLAAQERLRIRRDRERRARRLPVLLLLPLTTLVLPAFVLVTVVPFVIAGGSAIELPPIEPTQRGSHD